MSCPGTAAHWFLDPATSGTQGSAPNAASNNGTKSTPTLVADILGDWREEVIWRRSDNTALEIFSTIIPATNRMFTLMHDSQYRPAISWQNSGYNQPPHPSFFLGAGMTAPPAPRIFFASQLAGDYNLDAQVDAADYVLWRKTLGSMADLRADGNHDGIVNNDDYGVWRANFGISLPAVAATSAVSVPDAAPATMSTRILPPTGFETFRSARALTSWAWSDSPSNVAVYQPPSLLVLLPSSSGRPTAATQNARPSAVDLDTPEADEFDEMINAGWTNVGSTHEVRLQERAARISRVSGCRVTST